MNEPQVNELAAALRHIYRRLDLLHDTQSQITPKEIELMSVLDENGPTKVKNLAERLRLPLSTISWTADRMVNHKLLARKYDSRDRRVIYLTLTPNGRSVLDNHRAVFVRLAETALAALDSQEKETVLRAIHKVVESF
jgi:DNA-binding MarR family transcriptional regulator